MYLGLDLGTSGLRGLLIDENGSPCGEASAPFDATNPHPGWSEQDPALWTEACKNVIAALNRDHPAEMAALKGIGSAGHMHGATLLDKNGTPLRPCILWNDTRADKEARKLDATPGFRALSGNIVFPGFTAPKLLWVQKHEPEVFARIAKVLLPKDYLTYWLTGRYMSEMSDAAGTSWLDTQNRRWSQELLENAAMRHDQMPQLVEGSDIVGEITTRRSLELGLPPRIPVVGGGADNAAAACGVGALKEGQGFASLGTSGVLLAARDRYAPDPATAVHTFCHALPDTWYQMGVILSATDSLNWLATTLNKSPQALAAVATSDRPSPTLFLPYLSGERTPYNDASARGAFLGLSRSSDDAELAQAVLEGVAFALRDSLEALKSTGAQLNRLLAIGGGSNSENWVQILANTLNLPLDLPRKGDFGAALGAARLAMTGITKADPNSIMTPPTRAKTIDPNPKAREAYETRYQTYKAAYPALKSLL